MEEPPKTETQPEEEKSVLGLALDEAAHVAEVTGAALASAAEATGEAITTAATATGGGFMGCVIWRLGFGNVDVLLFWVE
jgi:hypothetical protein